MVLNRNDIEEKNISATNFAHLPKGSVRGLDGWQSGRLIGPVIYGNGWFWTLPGIILNRRFRTLQGGGFI